VLGLLESFARGSPIVPPSAAFGPCFVRVPARLAESELGFGYQSSGAPSPPGRWVVTSVSDRGPAYAAGLRNETPISAIDFAPYAAERPVRIRSSDGQQLEYRARTHTLPSVAWKRVPSVPDQRCTKP
jgi:hypothetical protein